MITWPNIAWLELGTPQADQQQAPGPAAVNLPGPSKNEFLDLIEQMLVPSAIENATIPDDAKVEKHFPEKETKDQSASALIINPPFVALAGPMTAVSQSEIPLHPPASATGNDSARDSDQKTGGTGDPPILSGDVPDETGGSPVPPKADEVSELNGSADQPEPSENAIASRVKQKGNLSAASAHSFFETTEAPDLSMKVVGDPVSTSPSAVSELPASAGELETPRISEKRIDIRSDESSKTLEAGKKISAIKPLLPVPFATPAETSVGEAKILEPELKPAPKLSRPTPVSPGYFQNHPSQDRFDALPFANPVEDTEKVRLPENVSVVSVIPVDGWPIKPSPAPFVGVFEAEVADKQADEPPKKIENALTETVSPEFDVLKTEAKLSPSPAGHLLNGMERGVHATSASIARQVVQNQGRLPTENGTNPAPHYYEKSSSADWIDAATLLRVEDCSNKKQSDLMPKASPEKLEAKPVSEKAPGNSNSTVATPIHKLLEASRNLSKASELRVPVSIFSEGLRTPGISMALERVVDPAEIENGPVAMDEAGPAKSKPEVCQPLNETKKPVEEAEQTTRELRPRTHSGTESAALSFDSDVSHVSEFTARPRPARPDPSISANLEFGGAADLEFRATEAVSSDSGNTPKQPSATTQPIPSLEQSPLKNGFPDPPKRKSFAGEVLKSAPIDFPEPPLNSTRSTFPEQEHSGSSPDGPAALISSDGKEPAKQEPPMKFTRERNKFAERTLQKLPRFDFGERESFRPAEPADAKVVLEKSERKEQAPPHFAILDSSAVSQLTEAGKTFSANAPQSRDKTPDQIERIAGWINTEVFAIRKTGVRSLTVSLKIDERTEISLGLENHEGKVQVSIQCERGDLSGAEHHWEQLQESLSRHDVQLLPLQPGNSGRTSVSDFQPGGSSHFQQQPHGQERGRSLEFSFEEMFSASSAGGGKINTPKKPTPQRGWESWA